MRTPESELVFTPRRSLAKLFGPAKIRVRVTSDDSDNPILHHSPTKESPTSSQSSPVTSRDASSDAQGSIECDTSVKDIGENGGISEHLAPQTVLRSTSHLVRSSD